MRRFIVPVAILLEVILLVWALFANSDSAIDGDLVVAASQNAPSFVCTPAALPAARSVSAPNMAAALTAMPPIQPLTSSDEDEPPPSDGGGVINDPVVQDEMDPNADPMPTPELNRLGINNLNVTQLVPDSNIAVGPNHLVQLVNASFKIWTRVGNQTFGPYSINMLWQGFEPSGTRCHNNHVDPIVLYDAYADRWVIATLSKDNTGNLTNRLCVAVSDGPDPLLSRYHRYLFEPTSSEVRIDYPKLGIWPDGYYASVVNLDASNAAIGTSAVALQRDTMLTGREGRYQACIASHSANNSPITLLPSDMEGSSLYHNQPPPPVPYSYPYQPNMYATIGDIRNNTDTLDLYRFHVDWASPGQTSFEGPFSLTTASFDANICQDATGRCIPQPAIAGTPSPKLRTQSHRLMYRLAYRNRDGLEG